MHLESNFEEDIADIRKFILNNFSSNIDSCLCFGTYLTDRRCANSDVDIILVGDDFSDNNRYLFKENLAFDIQMFNKDNLEKKLSFKSTRGRWLESLVFSKIIFDKSGWLTEFVKDINISFDSESRVGRDQALLVKQSLINRLKKIRNCLNVDSNFIFLYKDILDSIYLLKCYENRQRRYIHISFKSAHINEEFVDLDTWNRYIISTLSGSCVDTIVDNIVSYSVDVLESIFGAQDLSI